MAGLPRPTSFARRPVKYTREQPVSAALLIWLGLIGIAAARQRAVPSQQEVMAYAVGTLVIIIAASYLPDVVTWALLAVLVVAIVQNRPLVQEGIDNGWRRLQEAFAS